MYRFNRHKTIHKAIALPIGALAICTSACSYTGAQNAVAETQVAASQAQVTTTKAQIVVVDEAGGDSYMVGPKGDAEVKFKLHASDTNNAYEVITEDHPIGFESEPHVHPTGSETFYIIKGNYDYRLGDKTGTVGPGAVLHVPPNTVHVIHSKNEGRVLMVYSPPELETRTKALSSIMEEEKAVLGAVRAKLAEYGHVGVDE